MVAQIIRRFFSTFLDHHPQQIPNITTQDFISITTTSWSSSTSSATDCGNNNNNANNSIKTFKKFPLSINGLNTLDWLFTIAPCFPINGEQIHIIHEPNIFYNTLLEKCSLAKKRIIFASLYLGIGKLENKLINTMENNLKNNSLLNVNILLDFTRGTRGKINSKTMLLTLIKNYENSFNLSLYHTPVLSGIKKKLAPSRWNELIGLQHMKIYLFDNYVILSGANLSNDYFTNRQDRYIMINDENLANFYEKFFKKVQEFSLNVNKMNNIELHKNWNLLPYDGKKRYEFAKEAKQRMCDFFKDTFKQQELELQKKKDADTWIFPLIEMGQLGIHHDSIVTKKLFSSAINDSKFKLATGYFNLTEEYMDTITNNCVAKCDILMAHPNANGFQGASGPAGGIPAAYSLLAKSFYERLCNAKQEDRVRFYEYQKDGWTYHAKGLWYYLPNSKYPNLTLIGSSNFGERSVNRDLETQICIVTCNELLQKRLQDEVEHLYKMGTVAENEINTRPVPKWVRAVVKIFKKFF